MIKKYNNIVCLFACMPLLLLLAAAGEGPLPPQTPQPRHDIEMRTGNSRATMGRDANSGDGQGDLIWDVPLAEPRNEQQQAPPIIIIPEIKPEYDYQQPGRPTPSPGGRPRR